MEFAGRLAIDALIEPLLRQIQERQEDYLRRRGRYFQGIIAPSNMPVEGVPTKPTSQERARKPHYQAEDWSEMGVDALTFLPCQIEIHPYETHGGEFGYVVFLRVFDAVKGNGIERAVNVGTEEWCGFEWREIPANP
jgi:hypothetical protein